MQAAAARRLKSCGTLISLSFILAIEKIGGISRQKGRADTANPFDREYNSPFEAAALRIATSRLWVVALKKRLTASNGYIYESQ